MDSVIKKITSQKSRCFFISPHLDDAAFSAGGVISALGGKTDITIINLFSSFDGGSLTLSARKFLKESGFKDVATLYKIRQAEDKRAWEERGFNVINLDYSDALFRKDNHPGILKKLISHLIPEFEHLYPLYRFNVISRNPNPKDALLIKKIKSKLKQIIPTQKNVYIFCPAGFGNHIDHHLTRIICESIFTKNLIFWADVPYIHQRIEPDKIFKGKNSYDCLSYSISSDQKKKLCERYGSQINQVIPDKTMLFSDEYYFLPQLKKPQTYTFKLENNLNPLLFRKWQRLWNRSKTAHLYNSPWWFSACQETFGYKEPAVATLSQNGQLRAVIPLISKRKYFIKTLSFSGENYIDKSPLLMDRADPLLFSLLLENLKSQRSYFLEELDYKWVMAAAQTNENISLSYCSLGLTLPIKNDPLRFLSNKHHKPIKKIIDQEGLNFTWSSYPGNSAEALDIIKEIEDQSSKHSEFKQVFSNPRLNVLLTKLEKKFPGSTQIHILYYKGDAIAFQYAFSCKKIMAMFQISYKSAFSHLLPGRVSLYLLLSKLAKTDYKELDFSRGNTQFKRDFTPYVYTQYSLFYAKNGLISIWWKLVLFLYHWLENHDDLFELARKSKRRYFYLLGQKILPKKIPFSSIIKFILPT